MKTNSEIPEFIKFKPSPLQSEVKPPPTRLRMLKNVLGKFRLNGPRTEVQQVGSLKDKLANRLDAWNGSLKHSEEVFRRVGRQTNNRVLTDDGYVNKAGDVLFKPWFKGAAGFDVKLYGSAANMAGFLRDKLQSK